MPYTYEFDINELDAIRACNENHGFAVVKGLINAEMVEELKADVRRVLEPTCNPAPGATNVALTFIEESPVMARLLTYEPFMRIGRHMNYNKPMTLIRSAAIYKKPEAPPMAWHTDWAPREYPYTVDSFLNNLGGSSMWFYLNGTHPDRAGLAIIPDSHTEDWPGPEGFEFMDRRKFFYRKGTEPIPSTELDIPEVLPLFTEPGDLILFAEKTYHAVFPHNGSEVRLSCGMGFHSSSTAGLEFWPQPESAKPFIESCPPEVRPIVENYTGIDMKWVQEYNRSAGGIK